MLTELEGTGGSDAARVGANARGELRHVHVNDVLEHSVRGKEVGGSN